jgi:hypothetical protein
VHAGPDAGAVSMVPHGPHPPDAGFVRGQGEGEGERENIRVTLQNQVRE